MLTAAQFDTLAMLMGAREPVRSAARAVLVDGTAARVAASRHNLSPQSVSNSLRRYRKAHAAVLAAFCEKPT